MRHRTIHGYVDVHQGTIWRTVQEDLPGLVDELQGVIAELLAET